MTITPSSLAAINGVSAQNEKFAVTASVIPQRNVIIGTFDEATFATLTPNALIRVFSPEDVGSRTGFGFMLHRLAQKAWKAGGVETWIIPQLEGGSDPDQATGEIDFGVSVATEAGTVSCYIAGDSVSVTVAIGDTADDIGDALATAINNDDNMPVTAVNVAGLVTVTSKSGGTWGNFITIEFNLADGEELPDGVVPVYDLVLTGGAGIPDIQDALDAMGTGDGQNDKFFTNLIHGYGADTGTLNAISTYNGVGNTIVGNYKKEVHKPFRSLVGDTTAGTVGLAAALAFADLRRTDRTSGKLCVPGSQNHPQEIAAQAIGYMAVINSTRAEEGMIDKMLDGIWPGDLADRWTNEYDNRDQAVKGGLSTTFVKNNVVYLQNIYTFYRPADVAPESNGWRQMRNISIIQNMLYNLWLNFEGSKWNGISIVEDVTEVSNTIDREKARDIDAVMDDLVALAEAFAGNAWLYNSSYTIGELQKGGHITLRAGLTGFDINFPCILSGEGGIMNTLIKFDTSIAILSAGGAA